MANNSIQIYFTYNNISLIEVCLNYDCQYGFQFQKKSKRGLRIFTQIQLKLYIVKFNIHEHNFTTKFINDWSEIKSKYTSNNLQYQVN
jgi:hypothetical protein